jgi:hypothetical protein
MLSAEELSARAQLQASLRAVEDEAGKAAEALRVGNEPDLSALQATVDAVFLP